MEFIRYKKSTIMIFTISGLIMILSRCVNNAEKKNDPRGDVYAGSRSCRQCHQSIYDAYLLTSHYNTTQASTGKNISGSFTPDENSFAFDSSIKIVMQKRDSGFFQVLYVNGKEQEAYRFDITFGMKHAQTFLYWRGNKTFELPVSYYTAIHRWASSPGFSNTAANFKRFIGKTCFECHSSFIQSNLNQSPNGIEETPDKKTLVMGIDCERCHGPAADHVNYHLANPGVKEAKYIVSAGKLTRQQKLDVCAVCHSGNDKQKERSGFEFKMGDTLANFFLPWAVQRNKTSDFDVHGNQYQLLSQSKCFLESNTLDCSSCHAAHKNSGNDLKEYSKICLSCHQDSDHSSLKMEGVSQNIKSNCIDCHMPQQPSRAITFQLQGSNQKSIYLLRTHRIGIYRDQSVNTLLHYFKKEKSI